MMPTLQEVRALEQRATELLARSNDLVAELEVPDFARKTVRHRNVVSLQKASCNSKLSPIRVEIANSGRERFVPIGPFCSSTYVSIEATCPDSCPFKAGGCFAKAGASHLTMTGLNKSARGLPALTVTLAEAYEIDATFRKGVPQDGARGGRDLRLHVGGETSCETGARALATAAARWIARGGGAVWTFTHRSHEIPADAWGPISVLASVQTAAELEAAIDRGYAPAVTVDRFPSKKAFSIGRARVIPCPSEASEGKITCVQCRLCLDAPALRRRGAAIAFEVHGAEAEAARENAFRVRLPIVQAQGATP